MVLVSTMNLVIGTSSMVATILIPTLIIEFKISKFELASITLLYHAGMIIGSFLGGIFAKKYGRAPVIKVSIISQTLLGFMYFFCRLVWLWATFNFVFGTIAGICMTILSIYVNEIVPVNVRGRLTVIMSGSITIGRLLGVLLVYVFVEFNEPGKWQKYYLLISSFCLIFVILWVSLLRESLLYLWQKGDFLSFRVELNEIIRINNMLAGKKNLIGIVADSEIDALIQKRSKVIDPTALTSNFRLLFQKNYIWFNLKLWLIWMGCFSSLSCQSFILPQWYGRDQIAVLDIGITVLGEIPAIFISCLVIDSVSFGRKTSLQLFTFAMTIFSLSSLFANDDGLLIILFMLSRMSFKGAILILIPYTIESYPTLMRTISTAAGNSIGSAVASVVPFLAIELFTLSRFSIFYLFSALSLMAFLASLFLNFDTARQSLDKNYFEDSPSLDEKLIIQQNSQI
jgi:MFS family permease